MSETYGSLREKIAAEKQQRAERYAAFEALWAKAVKAGDDAANACVPAPMIVGSPTTPLGNDIDLSKRTYYVSEGACGFAWVAVRPGTSSFARWAVSKGIMRKAYSGGVQFWVGAYGQSIARKEAFAQAAAEVLRESGIKAFADSRLD